MDSLSERNTPYQTRIFPTLIEAQAWVNKCKKKTRWFSCRHVSPLSVTEMPRYLVVSHENGKYMNILRIVEECHINPGDTVIKIVSPAWRWATAGKQVGAYSTNGSIFSAVEAPTYIDVFEKGLETVSYVLLGPCQRTVEGADMELAESLLAKRPKFERGRFPQEAELGELKHGKKLITKKMRERTAELETAKATFDSARYEAAELFQAKEMQAWYDEVLRRCLPQG